jgi:hypothetical protein
VRSRLHTTLDQAIAAIPCPVPLVSILGSSLRASSLDDETASSLEKATKELSDQMKSNRKSTRQSDRLTYSRLCRKETSQPTEQTRKRLLSVTEGSTNRSTSKADYRANLLPQVSRAKPTDSSRQSGFFSIDEDNPLTEY